LEEGRSTGIFIHDPDPDRISAFVCISDVAFCDWDGYNDPVFAGLKNFKYILTLDPVFPKSVAVTFIYALINVPVSLILGLALAVLLNKQLKGIKFFRVIYYLPTIVPSVAAICGSLCLRATLVC